MADDKLHLDHPNDEPPPYEAATAPGLAGPIPAHIDEKTPLRGTGEVHDDPAPPYPGPSRSQRLAYTLELQKDTTLAWTLSVGGPSSGTWWKLDCSKNQKATMLRFFPGQMAVARHDVLSREVATIKFPSVKWAGPKITFAPHEAEIARKGLRHVSPTDRLINCSGLFSTKYSLDLPALKSSRVAWKVPDENDELQALKLEAAEQAAKLLSAPDEKRNASAEAPKELDTQSWSPYPTQYLIEETTGRVLATYLRAAPWAQETGILKIMQGSEPVTEEVIEGIVISCAVMVGMQYKDGIFQSLVESGYESIAAVGKGKGRALE